MISEPREVESPQLATTNEQQITLSALSSKKNQNIRHVLELLLDPVTYLCTKSSVTSQVLLHNSIAFISSASIKRNGGNYVK